MKSPLNANADDVYPIQTAFTPGIFSSPVPSANPLEVSSLAALKSPEKENSPITKPQLSKLNVSFHTSVIDPSTPNSSIPYTGSPKSAFLGRLDSSTKTVKFSDPASASLDSPLDGGASSSEEELEIEELSPNEIKDDKVICHGYIQKLSRFSKAWKKRWFVLRNGCLTWYKDEKACYICPYILYIGV
jgi:hypothetical protein